MLVASFKMKCVLLPFRVNSCSFFLVKLLTKSGNAKDIYERLWKIIRDFETMCVNHVQFILPGTNDGSNFSWDIDLPTNRGYYFWDTSQQQQFEHVLIIANVNVGRVVACNCSSHCIIETNQVSGLYMIIDVGYGTVCCTSTSNSFLCLDHLLIWRACQGLVP